MEFVSSEVSSIKSISQRSLFLTWARAAGEHPYPTFEAFQPSARASDPKLLVAWKVEGADAARTFRAIYQGGHVNAGFRRDWIGLTMDQVIPPGLLQPALEAACLCADTGEAIYMIYSSSNNAGHRLECERLLLPFGPPGGGVRQLLASMEIIGLDGHVKIAGVADYFNVRHEIALAARLSAARWRREARLLA